MRRVLGIAGWSGAGKTTLLAALVRELGASGLSLAVVKHAAHGLDDGDARRDSGRLFEAGAEVVAVAPGQALARRRCGDDALPEDLLRELERRHDLVLVEGWKGGAHDKVWLLSGGEATPPPEARAVVACLRGGDESLAAARELVAQRLAAAWRAAPLRAGLLAGGASRRMGRAKAALVLAGESLLARGVRELAAFAPVTVLGSRRAASAVAGAGDGVEEADDARAPQALPDAPGVDGPLGGILAARRWAPDATWVIAACDLPHLDAAALAWLLAQRAPGRWAILPRVEGRVQPLLAVYEPQAQAMLEQLATTGAPAPSRLAGEPRVVSPEPPAEIARAWRGVNTPEEWAAVERLAT